MAMELRGNLNLSKFHEPGSNKPRFYGRALIDGKTYELKGWEKTGPNGPWISLLFEPQEEFEQMAKPAPPAQPSLFSSRVEKTDDLRPGVNSNDLDDFEDDIPF